MKTNRYLLAVCISLAMAFTFANAEEDDITSSETKEKRFGIMAAYNNSFLIPDFSEDGGSGFTIGGIFENTLKYGIFRSEFNLIYRTPVVTDEITVNEISMGVNFLSRSEGFICFEGGLHLGFPINLADTDRSGIDIGAVLGLGLNVNENIAFGLRFLYTFTDFGINDNKNNLLQPELGLSYMF